MTKDEERRVLRVIRELEIFLKRANKPIDCISNNLTLEPINLPGSIKSSEKTK